MSESRWTGNSTTGGGGGGGPVEGVDVLSTGEAAGLVLTSDGANGATWTANGTGDVTGPASSTDNAVVRFDGVTGKIVQDSIVTISDIGNIIATRYTFPTVNTFVSVGSGIAITSGLNNTLIGNSAGTALTTQSNNVFIGHQAGNEALTSEQNVVIGSQANAGTAGQLSVIIGRSAGSNNHTGTNNVVLGPSSGTALTSGSTNIVIGSSSGTTLTTGSNNIILAGSAGQVSAAGATNELVIGSTAAPILNAYVGRGVTSATTTSLTLAVTSATGTNVNAGSSVLRIQGARGTGTGAGGSVEITTAPIGPSGSSLNTPTAKLLVQGDGFCQLGAATDGPSIRVNGEDVASDLVMKLGTDAASHLIVQQGNANIVLDLAWAGGTVATWSQTLGRATHEFGNSGYSIRSGPLETTMDFTVGGLESFILDSSGIVQIGHTGSTVTHAVNTAVATPAADVLTMTNGPTGTAGDPDVYLRLQINGTVYAFPGWAV
jgi:hypothetical protein